MALARSEVQLVRGCWKAAVRRTACVTIEPCMIIPSTTVHHWDEQTAATDTEGRREGESLHKVSMCSEIPSTASNWRRGSSVQHRQKSLSMGGGVARGMRAEAGVMTKECGKRSSFQHFRAVAMRARKEANDIRGEGVEGHLPRFKSGPIACGRPRAVSRTQLP
jgi:hypothetical protein